jgi:hypothetical protein
MTVFQNYIDILAKCYTLEIENKSFLPFIQKYPEYKRYYNFGTGEFDSQKFLYQILNDGTVNLLHTCYVNKKEIKNIFAYIRSLIEMKNSYIHIIYCLPVILERINKELFFTEELASLLSEPFDLKDIGNEEYINVQSDIIDFLALTYPNNIKIILKKYKFDMLKKSEVYNGSKEPDYSEKLQYLQNRNYLKYLKQKSIFLTETFIFNIDYNL